MPNESGRIKFYDEEKVKQINPETLRLWKKYEIDMSLRELSKKTIEGYQNDCQHLFIYTLDNYQNVCITELDEDKIVDFLFYCKMEGNNSRRIKRRMSSISAFYKYLRKKKIIAENPMEFIDRPKKDVDVAVQTYLSKEQIKDMKIKLKEHGDLTLETYILFSLSTMARVNAVSNLTWKQIDLENRVCNDVREKEGYLVVLYFDEDVRDLFTALKKYREENKIDDGGYIFFSKREDKITTMTNGSLNDWCHKVGRMIGVDTLHCHDLRHSMATLYKNEGMPLEEISALLNHASTDVTKKFYIKADKSKISKSKDSFII